MTFWCRDSLDHIWTVQSIYKALKCHITHPIFQATFTNFIKHIWTSSLVRYILFLKRIQTCSITNKYKCNLHTRKNNNFGGQFGKFHKKIKHKRRTPSTQTISFSAFYSLTWTVTICVFLALRKPLLETTKSANSFFFESFFCLTHKN